MNISPVASASIPALQTASDFSLNAVNALSSGASAHLSFLDAIQSNSIIVDVSTLGELLASTTRLQSKNTAPVAVNDAVIQANTNQTKQTKLDMAQLTLIAELLVDSFNRFQASNSNLAAYPLIPTSNDSLLQAMNAGTLNAAGETLFEQLAKIGISLQNTALPGNDTLLTLDMVTFQNALTKDPSATISLLTQSLQLLGNAETTLIIQNQEFSSGNIYTTTSTQKTALATTSTSATDATGNTPPSSVTNTNELVPGNAEILLNQVLTTEALLSAIASTNNPPAATLNTSPASDSNAVIDQAKAAGSVSPASQITSAELPVTNDVAILDQTNTPAIAEPNIVSPATVSSNTAETGNLPATTADRDSAGSTDTVNQAQSNVLNTPALDTVTLDNTSNLQANQASLSEPPAERLSVSSPSVNSLPENDVVTVPVKLNNLVVPEQIVVEDQITANQAIRFSEALQAKVDLANAASGVTNTRIDSSSLPAATNIAASIPASIPTPTTNTSIQPNSVMLENAATNTAVSVNGVQTGVQTGVPTAVNPLIAAAIAAFRMGDGIEQKLAKRWVMPDTDAVTAPEEVTAVQPVKLDLHERPYNQQHDTAAEHAYHLAEDLGQPGKRGNTASIINLNA
ncbi:hypothetical protein ACO0K9_17335 [Undibacterium sp. Ji50W]|uniref:hypothetical protein n=1 Tax=Undibacterium sp. Ji50W TaxID=3413041 RepID=UPI003BEF71F9